MRWMLASIIVLTLLVPSMASAAIPNPIREYGKLQPTQHVKAYRVKGHRAV